MIQTKHTPAAPLHPYQDATRIKHNEKMRRAKAYPRLVEALRNCVMAQRMTGGPKGSTENAATVGAEHLLRELREDK